MDFTTIDYLQKGSAKQQKVYKALRELEVFERLSHFTPVLAGTFPIDLDIEGSDIDVLCEVHHPELFRKALLSAFGKQEAFRSANKLINGVPSVIVRFEYLGFTVEFFGQAKPVIAQDAYKHMVVEHYLLQNELKGARTVLKRLKRQGLSTEAAFARLLDIKGDPYKGLIGLGVSLGLFP